MLEQLNEPLLIRGYFSAKTHPLLAPLVPQIRDMIREYELASGGKVRAEFVDPRENPELEQEAAQKYSIKPVPFQIEGKYEASLVNSYFNILVLYGDKFEELSFQDLIEVKASMRGKLDVRLRNLEYDLTRSIKKVLYGFQGTDALFANMQQPVEFIGYISADAKLPEKLQQFKGEMVTVVKDLEQRSKGKLKMEILEPEAEGGKVAAEIGERYEFRPMIASLFNPERFYFYMVLKAKDRVVQIPLPEGLSVDALKQGLDAGLKRFAAGFLKTIGLVTPPLPPPNPYLERFMGPQGKHFTGLTQKLGENYSVKNVDLKKGVVPGDVDLLMVVAPDKLDQKQLFAVDQFLMRGGTVVLSTAPYSVVRAPNALNAEKRESGLEDWLERYGITLKDQFVLDPQCDPYPVPRQRNLGGFTVEEIELKEYPYFVSIRANGMNEKNPILSGLPQVTMNWSSPLLVDEAKNKDRKVTKLMWSSPDSWTSSAKTVTPDYRVDNRFGVKREGKIESRVVAAAVEGVFESYFKDKEAPLAQDKKPEEGKQDAKDKDKKDKTDDAVFSGKIDRSPESARVVVYASNEFLSDEVLQVSAMLQSTAYLSSLQLMENTADWSLEDPILLSIRSRGGFSKTLAPMDKSAKFFWEYVVCYGGSLLGLAVVFLLYRLRRKEREARYAQLLAA